MIRLGADASHTMNLGLTLLTEATAVQAVETEIRRLQGDHQPELRESPDPEWCA